ncbi:oligopeptide ABC transporter permease OppB [Algiphilus sp.]|uniref:oligopeptide ABC transporter permease OppB n=1 Tax=Algiphilus sp. TaxID=1872431 RepID=UPI002A6473E4|nr:oligopeptide ABC transporter permease OppB [Pseudomonadota bacterium]
MTVFAFRRLAMALPTLLVLVTVAFFLLRAAPGGPFDNERVMPDTIRAQIEAAYHLDEPLWRQYLIYMGNLAQGDLGPSFRYEGRTVNELIAAGLPVSLTIGGLALLLALALGTAAGVTAALRRGKATDHLVMGLSMTGISIPNFVIAPLLILAFAVYLGWLPAGGWENAGWRHLVLPVVALALPQVAYVARLLRGSLIEVLSSDYIRTAYAKGLPTRTVILRHALRPALVPVVSYLGPAAAALITGSVVMEQIFGIPGLGRHFVQGALNRDYTLVLGLVLFYGGLIIAFNFVVDLLYGVLDPRMRQCA